MSAGTLLPDAIRDELAAMQRQDRELTALRGIGRGLKWVCLAWAACLIADAIWNLSPTIRAGLLLVLAVTTALAAWWFCWRPLNRRRSWTELAAAVERDHPELAERLVTLVELEQEPGRTGSPVMQALLAKQTARAVSRLNFTDSLPAGKSLQTAAIGLIALALLLIPFLIPGQRYVQLWGRLMIPFGNHAWGTRVAIDVIDGDRVVPRGDDVTIEAEVWGLALEQQSTAQLRLVGRDPHGGTREQSLTWQPDAQKFFATLARVEHDLTYRIESRWAASPEHRLSVANRPTITAWTIDIEPPPYTGLPASTLQAAVNELRVPERSRVRFDWKFAEPVSAGVIDWPVASADGSSRANEIALTLSEDRRSASAEVAALASGKFGVRLVSPLGLDSDEPQRNLTLIADEPPTIELAKDQVSAKVRPDDVLTIAATARDDYGLSAWELHWETSTGEKGVMATPAEQLTGQVMESKWLFPLMERSLSDGQAVTLRFRAADHYPALGPHEIWSDPLVIAISTDVESLESRAVEESQESLEQQLEALREAVAEQQEAVDERHRETARNAVKGEQQPENQEALEELRKRQEALNQQLAAVQDELAERPFLEQAAKERMPAVENSLSEAKDALSQAADNSEAREQIENLSRALDELGTAQEQLDKLSQETKALAALEQELAELSRLSRRAEQLAQEAERLSKDQANAESSATESEPATPQNPQPSNSESAANPDNSDQESLETLRRETEELTEHLDDLLRRRPELLEAARNEERERLAHLGEIARRMADRQQQLAETLSNEAAAEDRPADATAPGESAEENSTPPDESQSPEERAASQPANAETANSPQDGSPRNEPQPNRSQQEGSSSDEEPSMEQDAHDNAGENSDGAPAEQQQQLSQAADALRQALEKSAERLSQAPLDSSVDGENAAAASESVESAQESMAAALDELNEDNPSSASESAQNAQRQLQEAAERASPQNSQNEPPSPASRRVPQSAAREVTDAVRQLDQAREAVECACQGGKPGSGKSAAKSASKSAARRPGQSGAKTPGSEKSTAQNSLQSGDGEKSNGKNAAPSFNPKPGEGQGETEGTSESAVSQSAKQLRQAAAALAAASQSRRPGKSGRAQRGQSASAEPSPNSTTEQSNSSNREPGENSESTEGFAEFGAGSAGLDAETELATGTTQPLGSSRNWGRLPPHLRSEIRQGTTKTPHPEYAPQIKRYFERIAEPAKAKKRP